MRACEDSGRIVLIYELNANPGNARLTHGHGQGA
jgi:hypothetical protein